MSPCVMSYANYHCDFSDISDDELVSATQLIDSVRFLVSNYNRYVGRINEAAYSSGCWRALSSVSSYYGIYENTLPTDVDIWSIDRLVIFFAFVDYVYCIFGGHLIYLKLCGCVLNVISAPANVLGHLQCQALRAMEYCTFII